MFKVIKFVGVKKSMIKVVKYDPGVQPFRRLLQTWPGT